ncbi:hypothetical protein [Neobacillus bataviensis]|nr:hypothetical protein [Neobacillus bataviensis]
MNVIASFESNMFVEITLQKLKENNVEDNQIVIIEMEMNTEEKHILDTMYLSNGISLFDGMAAWAVVGTTLGCIYGSVNRLGPIIIGLSGAILGAVVGFLLDLMINKRKKQKWKLKGTNKKNYDMLLIIKCSSKHEVKNIASICKNNNAVSLGVNQ